MPFKSDDDLFAHSTMTFGEHLDELRVCLFRAILGLAVAFILVLVLDIPDAVIKFIEGPLAEELQSYYLNQAEERVEKSLNELRLAGHEAPDISEVRDAIIADRLLPEVDFVDARQTLIALGKLYGASFPTTAIPAFAPRDILKPKEFCAALLEGRDASGSNPAKRVWSLLDEETRQLVEKTAQSGDEPANADDRAQLAAAITKQILDNEEFYRAEDFQEIQDTDPMTDLLESDRIATRQHDRLERAVARRSELSTQQFNGMLLTTAFPDLVANGPRQESMMVLIRWHPVSEDPRISIKSLGVHEAFMIWIKAALMVSLVVASPWVFWQIWGFVASGLYKHERRYIHLYLPISIILFIGGAAVCFFFVFHYVISFLLAFNAGTGIDPDIRITEWFSMALFLPIGFGVSFQLPLVMLFLQRIGIFSVQTYLKKWRVSVLVICVVSMLLTPADPWSMLLMACPLILLYFGGILMCKYLPRGRNPFREGELTKT